MRTSRIVWFVAGAVLSCVLLIGLIVIVVAIAWAKYTPKPAEVARLVARPLVPEGATERIGTEAEIYAALSAKLAESVRLGQGGSELATVAREYGDALNALKTLMGEAPSAQPLIRTGLETWKSSLEDDDRGFLLGLFGISSELSKLSEFSDKASTIHARIVACRLRVAEIAVKQGQPESATDLVTAVFHQAVGMFTVDNDTLAMRNVSGQRLTNVLVVVELTGRSGEQFGNLFFADTWEHNQVLHAICRSDRPGRETVRDVIQVRFRVIADQGTSRVGDLRAAP